MRSTNVLADGRLGEPVRVLQSRLEAGIPQRPGGGHHARGLEEQIQVLRLPVNPCVLVDRVGARDDIRNVGGIERLEGAPVDLTLVIRNPEITVRDGLALLRCQLTEAALPEVRQHAPVLQAARLVRLGFFAPAALAALVFPATGFAARRPCASSFEALAEALHQIDDVARTLFWLGLQLRLATLLFGLDDLEKIPAIVVRVLFGVPLRGELLDEHSRRLQFGGTKPLRGRKVILRRRDQLVGEPERRQYQRVVYDFERREVLTLPQHELGNADPLRLANGLPQQDIRAIAAGARGDVVGLLEEAVVDLFGLDEVQDVDRACLLQGRRLEVFGRQNDVAALGVFVSLDEIVPCDRLVRLLGDALVLHTRPILGCQQVESELAVANRRVHLDRDAHETERDCTFPEWSCHK